MNQQSAKRKGTNRNPGDFCQASQKERDPFSSRVCSCLYTYEMFPGLPRTQNFLPWGWGAGSLRRPGVVGKVM